MSSEAPAQKKRRIGEEEGEEHGGVPRAVEEYEVNPELLKLLLRTKAEHFVNPDKVVFVCQREDKVVDVWKGLVKHNFLSVPVLQKTESKYFGFLALPDIVRYLVKTFSQERLRMEESFWSQVEEEKLFGSLLVNDLMTYPLSRKNPFNPVREGYSLLFAVELLARENHLHRVPVISHPDRQLLNMITQSQVVAFLNKNITALGSITRKPLRACPYLFKEVVTVQEDSLAIEAFNMMVDVNVSGCAVVDASGQVTGALSLRDMKLVGYDVRLFWRFYQSVREYLQRLQLEYQGKHQRPVRVVTATVDDQLGTVIQKLALHRIHRLFIVDRETGRTPIGVVSLKDVLFELIHVA